MNKELIFREWDTLGEPQNSQMFSQQYAKIKLYSRFEENPLKRKEESERRLKILKELTQEYYDTIQSRQRN
jgi:hypothetical protein